MGSNSGSNADCVPIMRRRTKLINKKVKKDMGTKQDKGFEVGLQLKLEWMKNKKLPKVILEILGRRVRLF